MDIVHLPHKTKNTTIIKIRSLCVILFSILFTNCQLSEKSVTGKWVSFSDTLFVNQNHSFVYVSKISSYDRTNLKYDTLLDKKGNMTIYVSSKSQDLDTSFNYYTGKWTVSNRALHLSFDQDKKVAFGNCDQLWNWRTFFSSGNINPPLAEGLQQTLHRRDSVNHQLQLSTCLWRRSPCRCRRYLRSAAFAHGHRGTGN